MVFPCYLAITAAEAAGLDKLPLHPAWMACHFSSYGTGLSNCPAAFPQGAMLIVNDRVPVAGHDPALIASQLQALTTEFAPAAVLLDFQRPGEAQTAAIAKAAVEALDCPVGVSPQYAQGLSCPVFLPPPPPNQPLEKSLAAWPGREVWLEAGLTREALSITAQGCRVLPDGPPDELPDGPPDELPDGPPAHLDKALHCHYHISLTPGEARFSLFRTAEDLRELLTEAAHLGVRLAVGLYQELGGAFAEDAPVA